MTAYVLSPSAKLQKVGDEMVVLNLDNGQYYGLNDVGCRIVELLQELRDVEAVLSQLQQEYDVGAETLNRDMQDLLDELERHELIKHAD